MTIGLDNDTSVVAFRVRHPASLDGAYNAWLELVRIELTPEFVRNLFPPVSERVLPIPGEGAIIIGPLRRHDPIADPDTDPSEEDLSPRFSFLGEKTVIQGKYFQWLSEFPLAGRSWNFGVVSSLRIQAAAAKNSSEQ